VIPPRKSAAFVWRMEEILDLYEEPYDRQRPVICFDERPCQLIGDVRDPLPMKPGCISKRFDSEYERGGVCWVLMSFEPLSGWRELVVTERRRKREFAHWMRRLVEEHYPQAEKIRVVLGTTSRLIPVRPSMRTSQQKMLASWLAGSSFATRRYMGHG
jgi:DDE superfamily endonuclease